MVGSKKQRSKVNITQIRVCATMVIPTDSIKNIGGIVFFHTTLLDFTQLYKCVPVVDMCTRWHSRINCNIRLDASKRSWEGVCVNRSAREVKCKSALSSA